MVNQNEEPNGPLVVATRDIATNFGLYGRTSKFVDAVESSGRIFTIASASDAACYPEIKQVYSERLTT